MAGGGGLRRFTGGPLGSSMRTVMPAHAKPMSVAAIQMVSENGDISGNLSRASMHVQRVNMGMNGIVMTHGPHLLTNTAGFSRPWALCGTD